MKCRNVNSFLKIFPAFFGICVSKLLFRELQLRCELHTAAKPRLMIGGIAFDPEHAAGQAVREFCGALGADGLGLMFLDGRGSEYCMTPLVYVPGSGTCFWENSCASGSAAVGMYLAAADGAQTGVSLREPGGVLHVTSDRTGTRLRGNVRLAASHKIEV